MLQVVDNYIMIHDVSHKHHDTYRIVRKLAILIMQAYDGISLWTCGNILASSNTTSCLIICLLNVRNLIKTIHNLYTMSFWKHILSQKHQLTKELPCTGDQSALIVWSCFPYHSSLTACIPSFLFLLAVEWVHQTSVGVFIQQRHLLIPILSRQISNTERFYLMD